MSRQHVAKEISDAPRSEKKKFDSEKTVASNLQPPLNQIDGP